MCCDMNGPDAYRSIRRRARKEHWCVECGDSIPIGAVYVYASGVWDGRGNSFHYCLTCDAWIDAFHKAARERRLCACYEIRSFRLALEEYQDALADKEREAEIERRMREVRARLSMPVTS